MKKLVFVFLFLVMVLGLCAQTGLMGLYYGEYLSDARKNLEGKGFLMTKNWPYAKEFALENHSTYYMVAVYVNQATTKIVGWSVYYADGQAVDFYTDFFAECLDLHGADYNIDEDLKMISWSLDKTKTFTVAYDEDDNIKVAVYYDDDFTYIFDKVDEKP